jgi:hypothetical protein
VCQSVCLLVMHTIENPACSKRNIFHCMANSSNELRSSLSRNFGLFLSEVFPSHSNFVRNNSKAKRAKPSYFSTGNIVIECWTVQRYIELHQSQPSIYSRLCKRENCLMSSSEWEFKYCKSRTESFDSSKRLRPSLLVPACVAYKIWLLHFQYTR